MSWLEKSIMYTRGSSKGKVGKTHELTEKVQGKFQYTMGPYSDPVLRIDPGDRVVVETVDAFEWRHQDRERFALAKVNYAVRQSAMWTHHGRCD